MSLFPAFSQINNDGTGSGSEPVTTKWLENSSFVPAIEAVPLPPISPPSSNSRGASPEVVAVKSSGSKRKACDDYKIRSSHKHKKKKHKKDKRPTEELLENNYSGNRRERISQNDSFFLDTNRDTGNLLVDFVKGPHQPVYKKIVKRPLGWKKYGFLRRQKPKRYFTVKNLLENKEYENEECRPKWDHDVAMDLKNTTENLNKAVNHDPCDIQSWLKLVQLQPFLLSLQPRKGPCYLSSSEKRGIADKQISILDKALGYNPTNPDLIRERYGLASTLVPADELTSQLKKYLSKEPNLVAGWLELARIERSHLASCSIPKIIKVFSSAMDAINKRRSRFSNIEVENSILELVLACGIFLQEASLQEQTWVMLRLYTEMSLGVCRDPDGVAEIQNIANAKAEALENDAAGEEDQLLLSGLPSSELWLRVERLRESAHFLPAPDCVWAREGDPQRLVYPDDMASLSQHITSKSLGFRVAAIALVVLGVPPLPFRHCAVKCLSQYTPLPNLGLLAAGYPLFSPDIITPRNWIGDAALQIASTCGANAWKPALGGELYRDLLYFSFYKYATSLSEAEESVLMSWCLRWETLYARLMPTNHQAKTYMRSRAKKLLKKPNYRTSFQMFREFAMLDAALSESMKPAEKILSATIYAARASGMKWRDCPDRAGLCSVYRTLAEIWIQEEKTSEAITLLCSLVDRAQDPFCTTSLGEAAIEDCIEKYESMCREILQSQTQDTLDLMDAFSEDFLVNMVACYAWLMVLSRNVWIAGAMLEGMILKLNQFGTEKSRSQTEIIYEIYCAIMQNRSRNSSCDTGMLHSIIERALAEFPDNASILAVQAQLQNTLRQISKLTSTAKITYGALGQSMRILSLEHRSILHESEPTDQLEVARCEPRVVSQYEKVLANFEFRHCPLLWQLYLRYMGFKAKPEAIRTVFYKALEDCPWVKAIYMQGARLLPEESANIQDLVVEKELRLHIAPEELELLKGE
ncbi:nuclear exosome regulator NRDE2 [Neocloeon triangulifer]|uniref:nuclear exosome regulator NRDE2 n=1 Tax=Neocloeon triangulifer TaxID=2078957 RepID=UPI00286F2AAC|nr:nuclear exosome regulator NRDE2 [Neocloeon triangulifer]